VVDLGAGFLVDARFVGRLDAAFFVAMVASNLLSITVTRHADPNEALALLEDEVVSCRRCPRLIEWCERVAVDKRAAYRDEVYWGKPIPGFGDPAARVIVLGLAPAAHGANRTGRVFTGDRSGDWLFRAMYRAGLANQPTSISSDDGLALNDAWVTAAVKCAPPANKPLPVERDACAPFLKREIGLLESGRVMVCLGGFGYEAACRHFGVRPRPKFGHGVEVDVESDGRALTLLCSFHPSQQNTFTKRLTEEMLDAVFTRAVDLANA